MLESPACLQPLANLPLKLPPPAEMKEGHPLPANLPPGLRLAWMRGCKEDFILLA